jgi:hypothetical protein
MNKVVPFPDPIKEQPSSFVDINPNNMQKFGKRVYVNVVKLPNRGKLDYSDLHRALSETIGDRGPAGSVGFTLSPGMTSEFKKVADYLSERGVNNPEAFEAIMNLALAHGFEPSATEKPVLTNIRIRKKTTAKIDRICDETGIKRSQLVEQMFEFFFSRFEGLPEQEPGPVLMNPALDD